MAGVDSKHRVSVTLTGKEFQILQYWADKGGVTINQYLKDALDTKIAWENKDYPLPTLEQARLNQLIDAIEILSSNQKSLENVVVSGLDSLLGLTRGDNYLLEHEDGEL